MKKKQIQVSALIITNKRVPRVKMFEIRAKLQMFLERPFPPGDFNQLFIGCFIGWNHFIDMAIKI